MASSAPLSTRNASDEIQHRLKSKADMDYVDTKPMSTLDKLTRHIGCWSQSVATHSGIRTLFLLRLVDPRLSFDPSVLSCIRTVVSTLLEGDLDSSSGHLIRIRLSVLIGPGPLSHTLFFKALFADIDFTCTVVENTYRHDCLGLLAVMPPMAFSLKLTLALMSTKHYNRSTPVKATVDSLAILSWCVNQGPVRKEELKLLKLIMEDLLWQAGLYACTECLLFPTRQNGYAIRNVTALDVFMAIPGKFLRGHHLQRICDSYEFGCEEWKEVMRRALCVSREHGNVSVQAVWESIITSSRQVESEPKSDTMIVV